MLKHELPVTQNMTTFGYRAFKEVIKLKGGPSSGPLSNLSGVLVRRKNWTHRKTQGMCHCEGTVRRPQKKPNPLTP